MNLENSYTANHRNCASLFVRGTGWLAYHQANADDDMYEDRVAALYYHDFDVQAAMVPPETLHSVIFEDGTDKYIEHAVALKRYNGESEGQYCEWDDDEKEWVFNRLNNLGFNYVERVCEVYP